MVFGLIGAGPVNEYLVAKLPRLGEQLGPVAAANHRLASRIVNTLKAGEALRDFAGLDTVSLIFICAPGAPVAGLVPALERSALGWPGKSVVLCCSDAYSHDLQGLRERGASVGSLDGIRGLPGRYLIEGDPNATKAARSIVDQLKGSYIEIETQNYPAYRAALTISTSMLTPILEACAGAVRGAGVSRAARVQILEGLVHQTLREYLYSGRRSWDGAVALDRTARVADELEFLDCRHPEIADFYRSASTAAIQLLGRRGKTRQPERA